MFDRTLNTPLLSVLSFCQISPKKSLPRKKVLTKKTTTKKQKTTTTNKQTEKKAKQNKFSLEILITITVSIFIKEEFI